MAKTVVQDRSVDDLSVDQWRIFIGLLRGENFPALKRRSRFMRAISLSTAGPCEFIRRHSGRIGRRSEGAVKFLLDNCTAPRINCLVSQRVVSGRLISKFGHRVRSNKYLVGRINLALSNQASLPEPSPEVKYMLLLAQPENWRHSKAAFEAVQAGVVDGRICRLHRTGKLGPLTLGDLIAQGLVYGSVKDPIFSLPELEA